MTDFEQWKQFLFKFGIGFTEGLNTCRRSIENTPLHRGPIITLEAKENEKVVGYVNFYTTIYFSTEGKFINIGIWE